GLWCLRSVWFGQARTCCCGSTRYGVPPQCGTSLPPCVFLLLSRRPPVSTLFPYTTLFRSRRTRPGPHACAETSRQYGRRTFSQRSEEHTSELQSRSDLVCRLLLEKKKK